MDTPILIHKIVLALLQLLDKNWNIAHFQQHFSNAQLLEDTCIPLNSVFDRILQNHIYINREEN